MTLGVILLVTVTPLLKVLDPCSERLREPVLGSRRHELEFPPLCL